MYKTLKASKPIIEVTIDLYMILQSDTQIPETNMYRITSCDSNI